jgi:glycerol-3-phosphate dehydrogenase (NAD(P)+)
MAAHGTAIPARAGLLLASKGLVAPHGALPSVYVAERSGARAIAALGGPAHAADALDHGAALVVASHDPGFSRQLADLLGKARLYAERSSDTVGVELAGAAKNAAALAAGATERQGLNAAGAAAGHIFAEVWRFGEGLGARPESFIGLAGTGDLVATALAPQSRNRRAGELLADGVAAADIPERIGQAVEAMEGVPLLAHALSRAGIDGPVTGGLARLISGELPLDEWVALVRTTVPPPARWRPRRRERSGLWARLVARLRRRGAEDDRPTAMLPGADGTA